MTLPVYRKVEGSKVFTDAYGRYHDAEGDGYNYSSNNGFIYSAYAKSVGIDLEMDKITKCAKECEQHHDYFLMVRSPGFTGRPLSKDEVTGLASLGLLDYDLLEKSKFSYYNPIVGKLIRMNLIKAIKAIFYLKGKPGYTIYREPVYDAFPLNYRLSYDDQFHVKVMYGKDTSLFNEFYFYLTTVIALVTGKPSNINRNLLQTKEVLEKRGFFGSRLIGNYLLNKLKPLRAKYFAQYFKKDYHPITVKAKELL